MRIGLGTGTPRLARAIALLLGPSTLVFLLSTSGFAHDSNHDEMEAISSRIGIGGGTATDYLRRGELHRLSREWDAALADYRRAERLDPSLLQVRLCRAALFLDTGRPAVAKRTLDPAIAREPANAEALHLRAQALVALGHPLDAVRDLDRMLACTRRPTPDHYLERARLL